MGGQSRTKLRRMRFGPRNKRYANECVQLLFINKRLKKSRPEFVFSSAHQPQSRVWFRRYNGLFIRSNFRLFSFSALCRTQYHRITITRDFIEAEVNLMKNKNIQS